MHEAKNKIRRKRMKNVLSKLLLFVLVAATLISTVAILGSCGDKGKKEKGTVSEEAQEALAYLPDKDFKDEKFIIACRDDGAEFWREKAQGDRVDYAIFMRNSTIEAKYGVKIEPKSMEWSAVPGWVSDILKSGDDEAVDIVNNHIVYSSNIPVAGNAIDLQTIPYIDLNQDWWLDSTVEDLTLNGKTFIAIGDMHTSAISNTYCMYYNKDLVKEYKIPDESGDMYDFAIVQGKWTYSNMMKYLSNLRKDLDIPNRFDDNDLYGLVTSGGSFANAYLWAWDNPIFTKNDNSGELEFSLMNNGTKVSKILSDICKIYSPKTDGCYMTNNGAAMFTNNQAVFFNSLFGDATSSLRDMNSEKWGIVPYPKYNDKQKNYITAVDGGHNAICVPKTSNQDKLEKIGIVTEALNCLSSSGEGNLVTEYYDKGLMSKYLGDPKEATVIELIMDNRVFDFGYIYPGFTSPAFWIQEMILQNDDDIAGRYKTHRNELEGVMDDVYELFGLTFPGLP